MSARTDHETPADRKKREAAELARKLREQQEEDDFRWLLADERGRRIVWNLLGEGGIFRASYTGEAISSAHREGERNAALKLHAKVMQHAPQQFVRMLAEAITTPGK